jgi:dsDNA-specific endonuclease/ATPase MutS2
MLNIQKEYFIKTLESAIAEKFKKVIFIHGVGNGVLKNEIIKILRDYEGLHDQSASLAKFGVGAIDVVIN